MVIRKTLKGQNLKGKFGKFIKMENPDMKCFISGEKIEIGELSIDHVIPWSYIYSDDLWNLVFVSKSKKAFRKEANHQIRK